MTLPQVGQTAFNTAEEITDSLDGTHFRLRVQKLFQRLAHDIGAFTFLTLCSALQSVGQCLRQSQRQLRFHAVVHLCLAS